MYRLFVQISDYW